MEYDIQVRQIAMSKFILIFLMVSIATITYSQDEWIENSYPEIYEGEEEQEEKVSFWEQEYLTGDWGGIRSDIEKYGVTFEIAYIGEVVANVSGGTKRRGEYLDNIDLQMTVDAQKLFNWPGATFFLYALGNYGGDPTENVGDAQTTSNLEAPDTFKLYEAWWQQNLFDDKFSIKLGLYDVNSEFDVIETGGLFLSSAHGIGTDFSQSGINGPSIFPTTSLGARIRVQPNEHFYMQAAVLDGVPGDPNDDEGTQIIFDSDDGVLLTTEIAYLRGAGEDSEQAYGKFALGGWYYSGNFDDVRDVDVLGNLVERRGNSGLYFLAEQTIFREVEDSSQGLAIFARVGFADDRVNQFFLYTSGGLVYTGAIPGRDKDLVGVAVAVAHNGHHFKKANDVDNEEIAIEFTYIAQITSWFTIQPDIQYIFSPGTDPGTRDAIVLALRFVVLL